jgi:ABC-type proline/glycine betaine transport system permease subunit
MVFFMVYWNRTFEHHMITAIAMAAYTFLSFTLAILNVIKYKKYQSPVFSAAKAISFASACVSMLTLTSTMLTTFQDGSMDASTQKLMLGCVGAAVVAIVTYIAIYMIVHSTKKLKEEVKNGE